MRTRLNQSAPNTETVLRLPQVVARVNHSKSSIYEMLNPGIKSGAAIWRGRIRRDWGTIFRRNVLVELLPAFDLRVTDERTGDLIVQGPDRVESDRLSPSR